MPLAQQPPISLGVGDMIGIGIGANLKTQWGGGSEIAPPPPPPPPSEPTPTELPVLATARWHPEFSDVTTSAGRVVTATDLRGLAGLTEGAAGIGPKAMTDAIGRKFWRFEGTEFLNVATALVSDSRNVSVFMVGRVPRHPASYNRYLSLGNRAAGTQRNTLGGALDSRIYNRSAGHVQSFGKVGYTAPSGGEWLVPGAQLQVMGAATSSSGTRLFLNERFADVAIPYNQTNIAGAEIGRYAWSPSSSGNWGVFDLYELVFFAPGLSHADALAVSTTLMNAHNIVPVEHQLVLEGDSIMQGTGEVTEHLSAAAILTNPGEALVPANWRVINKGLSGNDLGDLVLKRDAANGWASQVLPGRNVMAFEIGRNDWNSTTAAQHYTNVVGYLNSASTGVLQRGWEVRALANIATAPGMMPQTEAHRAALKAPQFLSDTASGAGQAFDGKVSVVSTDLIEHAGQSVFRTSDDAQDTTYYAGDNTHPNILGARVRATGGDTPQHGIVAGL